MTNHWAQLPYPDRNEVTVGSCECGWLITYSWGGHGDAVIAAGEHINQAAGAEWVEILTFAGERTLVPGRSL